MPPTSPKILTWGLQLSAVGRGLPLELTQLTTKHFSDIKEYPDKERWTCLFRIAHALNSEKLPKKASGVVFIIISASEKVLPFKFGTNRQDTTLRKN